MILVKVQIEGSIQHLFVRNFRPDPMMPGRMLLEGIDLTLNDRFKCANISVRNEDIHYYSQGQVIPTAEELEQIKAKSKNKIPPKAKKAKADEPAEA